MAKRRKLSINQRQKKNNDMIEYTREEALDFYDRITGGIKEDDNSMDTLSPREIIMKALRIACIMLSDEAWDEELSTILGAYMFIKPIEDMPLLINEKGILIEIAKWRLSVAK